MQFEYRVCASLAKKPQLSGSSDEDDGSDSDSSQDKEDDNNKPKSDIHNDTPLFHIAQVGPSHELVLNRFSVYRPQYILLTNNPVHDQHDPLDRSDLAAALILLHASPSPIFVIYNCGEKAGCSRSHRHMQAFPCPGTEGNTALPLFPDRVRETEQRPVPFKYFLEHFPQTWLSNEDGAPPEEKAGELTEMYRRLLKKAAAALGIADIEEHIPHNVILVKEWIMVIPRRGGKVGGSAVNAASMIGLVWVKSEKELQEWQRLGIDESLVRFGVPADVSDR